ncbi:unnamed protein product [Linum trigynum]|uniref:Uncharacterized protein n=1 Tax=Linum trigynum TaxID=586398 RepID=A0AAV2DJH7_9ROSI
MNLRSKTSTSKEDAYLKNFLLFAAGVVVFLTLLASMSSFLLGRLRLSSSTAVFFLPVALVAGAVFLTPAVVERKRLGSAEPQAALLPLHRPIVARLRDLKSDRTYQILNSDDHANFLKKNNKNPADYRPDIVYKALLSILDSPLNKAGRTYKRFAGIMLQLLQKLSISAAGKREKLLRVIKNPVTQYLPVSSRKIGFSYSSDKLVEMSKYVGTVSSDADLVFVVGAMSHGKIDCDYIEDFIAISGYPLSAAWCIARICEALSNKLGVV